MNKLSLRQQNNPAYNSRYFEKCRETSVRKRLNNIENYNLSKISCLACNEVFEYSNRNKKFCDRSCSAKYNNQHRSAESRKKQKLTIRTKFNSDEKLVYKGQFKNVCSVTFIKCSVCSADMLRKSGSKNICKKCKLEKIKPYRRACKFIFTRESNPELFNDELIEKFGWYKPSNSKAPNLNGVTWDHLFKIEDGFRLGVDPKIMRHPANAELVTWQENINRHISRSGITLDELKERIYKYNSKRS